MLTSAESPGPKAENCSSTVRTWNTPHSRAAHTSLHQIQHVEELQPLIGYHYRGYIPSGFGYRALNPKLAVSHGNPDTKSLCLQLYRRLQNVLTNSTHRKLCQQLKILNFFFFLHCKTILKLIMSSNEAIHHYVLREIY